MNKQEILQKLIDHYEWCVANMPILDWRSFIIKYHVELGICSCADLSFKIWIYHEDWVKKHTGSSKYIFLRPFDANSRYKAIELLQKRIDLMKKEILIP